MIEKIAIRAEAAKETLITGRGRENWLQTTKKLKTKREEIERRNSFGHANELLSNIKPREVRVQTKKTLTATTDMRLISWKKKKK